MEILFIGDVSGRPGREALAQALPRLRQKHDIDVVITNIENVTHGRGASVKHVRELLSYGVDFMTAGNHIWRHNDFEDVLGGEFPVIRPINYPDDIPGVGYGEVDLGPKKGVLLVISALGKAFIDERTASEPFRRINEFLSTVDYSLYKAILIDFHAESSSEKLSAGLYYDGKVSAVVGTHTHVPTADERILPNGTAYINDVGMAGPLNVALWLKNSIAMTRNMYPYAPTFDMEETGPRRFDAVLISTKSATQSASIKRINLTL
jgi:metallophosphoesterase (TIGR00282 family)